MNRIVRPCVHGVLLLLVLLLGSCQTGPRAPTIRLEQVVRDREGSAPRWQQAEPGEVGVSVWRQGRQVAASRSMLLQPGDEVQTGLRSAAVIRFSGATRGDVTLSENTRVRVGSIEVFFGRVWADVRGLFEASSAGVVAGVEGTRFLFEVRPDRSVYVAVAEGVVNCRARTGGWRDVRLHANEALGASYPANARPPVVSADPRELREAAATAAQIADAPAYGWCCANGQVLPAWSNQCGGSFSPNRGVAEATCRPPPEPTGWCCAGGSVTSATRAQCHGYFDADRAKAAQNCFARVPAKPPVPIR